jgi:hypothetical protein
VVEAPVIDIKSGCWVFAHGGGGGGGGASGSGNGADGQNGSTFVPSPTMGGLGAVGGGAGGGGAYVDSPAGDGQAGTANGGGGGGFGRIFFRSRGAPASIAPGAVIKPQAVSTTTL